MYKSKMVLFIVILFFGAGLIYMKVDSINSDENALTEDSTDLVEFERELLEEQAVKLFEVTEVSRIEDNDVTKTEEADERKLDGMVDEVDQQITAQLVGNAGDSLAAESQLWNYLSDYAYEKKAYYPGRFSCESYICEVNVRFFTPFDDMAKQVSTLMRDLPYKEAYVDTISDDGLNAKLIIHTDELK